MGQRIYKRGDSPNWFVFLGKINGREVYRSTGCRDKRAAEARAVELEREHREPTHRAANETTLAAALARATEDRRARGRAEGTLHMWSIKAPHLTRVLGAATPLSQIDARAVDTYTTARLEEGAARNTIAKELGVLRATLDLARRREEYDRDPAAVMPLGWSANYQPRERFLTADEALRLLADLANDDLPQRRRSMANRAAQVAFIIATSARWGEATRARREDIAGGFVRLRGTKTEGAKRVVPILPAAEPLIALALAHGRETGALFEPWGQVRADLHRACERLKMPPISPNDLRRTTATWLRHAGVEPHLIALVLGHKDSRMVERVYGRMSPEALGDALRARVGAPAVPKPKK